MKCRTEKITRCTRFHVENLIAPLLVFRKTIYRTGIYVSQKIIDIMGLNNINIFCNVTFDVKNNGNDTYVLSTFNLLDPPGYLLNITTTNVLYQNVTQQRIEYIELQKRDEHGRPFDFIGDVLSFTLHLV